jgi:hypothetical protein
MIVAAAHACSIEVHILIFCSSSLSSKEIIVNFDFLFWFFHLLIVRIGIFIIAIIILVLSGSSAIFRLFVFLKDDVFTNVIRILEQVGIVLEEGATGHEIHLRFVLATLCFLSRDFLFKFSLLACRSICLPLLERLQCHWSALRWDQVRSFLFDLFFECHLVFIAWLVTLVCGLVSIQNVALGQHMSVGAVVASIRTRPIETIQIFLNSVQEIPTGDDCVWRLANFRTRVWVQVNGHSSVVFEGEIMTVFTFFALFANTSLEVGAQCFLVIDYKFKSEKSMLTPTRFAGNLSPHLLSPSSVLAIWVTPLNKEASSAF